MPFCGSCGAPMEGRFCGKCGATASAGGDSGAGAGAGVPPPGATYASPVAAPMQENVASTLCYVLGFITGIIFLVLEPYSKNRAVRFHAFQSIFLNVALFVINLVVRIVLFPLLPWGIYSMVDGLFGLACFGLWIYVMFSTYQGKAIEFPVIGPLARKQAQV